MTTKIKALALLVFAVTQCHAQDERKIYEDNFYKGTKGFNYRFKFTAYVFVNGGWGISAGFSNWLSYERFQPAQNISINAVCGKNNVGNRNKRYNRWQTNVIFSSMLTYALNKERMRNYDEVNPFYFGNSSAVYHNFQHALTLGTTFVALPKGLGRNIMTPRNRSQQLIYIQIKSGNFQLNLYEDYLIFTDRGMFAFLSDNRDRYYTGGGNVQLRLNKDLTFKYYTEMYTGNSYVDRDDYPDLIVPGDTMKCNFIGHPWGAIGPRRVRKYAYQDPGQAEFNHGRNFIALQMNSSIFTSNKKTIIKPTYTHDAFMVVVALQNGEDEMWQQNLIHSLNKIDRDIIVTNKHGEIRCKRDGTPVLKSDKLHFFKPLPHRRKIERLSAGITFTSDFVTHNNTDQ